MQHPSLLNAKAGSSQADVSRPSSEMKGRPMPQYVQRDKTREAQHVYQVVTTRGEGLTDLLMMKRDFEKHMTKFQKLLRRVEEMEKGNSFIRNLDLEQMVTPDALETKVQYHINFQDTKMENMRQSLVNKLEQRCTDVSDTLTKRLQERVSKKDYTENKAFMLAMIREAKALAKQSASQTDNLQTKYENLDAFYVPRLLLDQLSERQAKMEQTMNEKFKDLLSDYDSEDESQHNESIEDVSGELGGDTEKNEDTKSRGSLKNLRSNPELLAKDGDIKSVMSGGKNTSKKNLIPDGTNKPIIEVVTTLQDQMGRASTIKGVSIAAEEEVKSIKKSARVDFDGKSQKSFARSIRSRKLGAQQQAILDNMQERISALEGKVEGLTSQIEDWRDKNDAGWKLVTHNFPEFHDMIDNYRRENGFVGQMAFKENPLGTANKPFHELQEDATEIGKKLEHLNEDFDIEKEETTRQMDCMSKAVKQLQDQKLRRDEYDDNRIKAHLAKAIDKVEGDLDKRLDNIMLHVKNLQEPIHGKFLDMSKEAEGMSRQNMRFIQLYRECLQELQNEIKEKKQVLDTSQLAFLTADPGLVQQKIAGCVGNFRKQKQPVHGIPNQTETGQIWSRYTSEACQLKVDNLAEKIQQAEQDMKHARVAIITSVMTPKAINIGDCFNPQMKKHQSIAGGPGNPDLNIQLVQNAQDEGMLFERGDLTAGGTRTTRRRGVSTSYGNRQKKQFATLTNAPTSRSKAPAPLSIMKKTSNFDVASGNTLFLSSPTSEDKQFQFSSDQLEKPSQNQHTTPVINQNKLLTSHKNMMKNNVARFIKDHNLGTRHFSKEPSGTTTAVDTAAQGGFSDGVSWMGNNRQDGTPAGKSQAQTRRRGGDHPRSQMLNLSFKKALEKQ